MIVSAARLHGRASSHRRVYRRGGENDNQPIVTSTRGPARPDREFVFDALSSEIVMILPNDPRSYLSAQPFQAVQRIGAGFRDLDALDDEMLAEEVVVHGAVVELLRRQHRGEYRHLCLELHVHQRLDHGVGDEFVTVDAAIDHEAGRHDRGVAPRLGEQLRMQGDLERTRHLEQIDLRARDMTRLDLGKERDPAFLHHVAMPGRLHEGDPLRFDKTRMDGRRWALGGVGNPRLGFLGCLGLDFRLLQHLIHGFPLSGPESGHTERRLTHANARAAATVLFHPDFNRRPRNRTESADPSSGEEGARGLGLRHPYRRWGFSPRPENIGCPEWTTWIEYDQTPTSGQVSLASGNGMSPCPRNRACLFLTRFLHANRDPPRIKSEGM